MEHSSGLNVQNGLDSVQKKKKKKELEINIYSNVWFKEMLVDVHELQLQRKLELSFSASMI